MQSDPPIGLFASREVSSATMFAVIRVTRFFKFQSCFDNKSMRHSHSHFSLSNFDWYLMQYHLFSYSWLVFFPHRWGEKEVLQQVNITFQTNPLGLSYDDWRISQRKNFSWSNSTSVIYNRNFFFLIINSKIPRIIYLYAIAVVQLNYINGQLWNFETILTIGGLCIVVSD